MRQAIGSGAAGGMWSVYHRIMAGLVHITEPWDGDIVNRHDGVETPRDLTLNVRGEAPAGSAVFVNGVPAVLRGTAFSCNVRIARRKNVIMAQAGALQDSVTVFWDKGSRRRFRLSCDDCILFLRDLAYQPDRYPSLFDHWFLGFWRAMHEDYGAKVHLNIYYQTDGFDLTEMPAKWRGEWQQNAPWLHLSFHALQDKPDRPYRNAKYAQVAHDFDLVSYHIRRFAGGECISNTTTLHWAECPEEGALALRDPGIQQLVGLFGGPGSTPTTRYYLSAGQTRHCHDRGLWRDPTTGLTFIDCAAVLNALELDAIAPALNRRAGAPQAGERLELLIHEQYFRRELPLYQRDAMDKVRTALLWARGNGYEPVFWSDGYLGSPTSTTESP